MLIDDYHFSGIIESVCMQHFSFFTEGHLLIIIIRPYLIRREITITGPIRIRKRRIGRVDYIIIPVGISDLVPQRFQCRDSHRFANEPRQVDSLSQTTEITLQAFLEQFEESHHFIFTAANHEMDMVAHQFEGDNADPWTIKGACGNDSHRCPVILRIPENDRMVFRCVQVIKKAEMV